MFIRNLSTTIYPIRKANKNTSLTIEIFLEDGIFIFCFLVDPKWTNWFIFKLKY